MEKLRTILTLLFGVFAPLLAALNTSAAVTLYVWNRGPDVPSVILPVPDGMTPMQAWNSYLNAMAANPLLAPEFIPEPHKIIDLTSSSFVRLNYDPQHRSLMLGNSHSSLYKNQKARNWTWLMATRNIRNFVLPPAAGEFLSASDRKSLNSEVADHFALLLPTGGADIDPRIYGEAIDGAKDFNAVIDIHERDLITEYLKSERGFIYATCRGAQIAAVSLGYSLVQDVPTQWKGARAHWDVAHPIKLLPTQNNYVRAAWGRAWTVSVFSNHHESIDFRPGGPLDLAAVSSDGGAEVLELKNGRGILNQGHPELTLDREQERPIEGDKEAATKLFDLVAKQATSKFLHSCRKVFAD